MSSFTFRNSKLEHAIVVLKKIRDLPTINIAGTPTLGKMPARATLLLLLSLCTISVTSQIPPCGEHQCKPLFTTAETYKCYSEPDTTAWNYSPEHWTNCSALLGPRFKVVQDASYMNLNAGNSETTEKLDWCSMEYYVWSGHCLGCTKSWPGCKCENTDDCVKLGYKPTCDFDGPYHQWLQRNSELAQIEECHNVIKHWNCRTNVAPYDQSGQANHYAHRSESRLGSAACRSVCEELWDKCHLHNDSLATTQNYFSLEGLNCGTPSSGRINDQRYPKDQHGLTGCWHINGSISLPNCSAFMPFDCVKDNSIGWHPGCEGCLCKPGWGGADCSRCSTTERMWSEVYRDPKEYNSSRGNGTGTGAWHAASACASLQGIPAAQAQCTELNILRPIPAYVPPVFNHSGGKHKNGTAISNATHANATALNNNATRLGNVVNQFECTAIADSVYDLWFEGGLARLAYGIKASPSCFQPDLGGWSSDDCTVGGNISFNLIKAREFKDHGVKPIHGYSPDNTNCVLSGCEQGEHKECLTNSIPKDYVEPCIKCSTIQCRCRDNGFRSWIPSNFKKGTCNMELFAPGLTTGMQAPSYLGCSGGDNHCIFFNEQINLKVNMPRCQSSTCKTTHTCSFMACH